MMMLLLLLKYRLKIFAHDSACYENEAHTVGLCSCVNCEAATAHHRHSDYGNACA